MPCFHPALNCVRSLLLDCSELDPHSVSKFNDTAIHQLDFGSVIHAL